MLCVEEMSVSDHNETYGWHRFKDRWPIAADCDIYGQIEVAGRGNRGFSTLNECADFRYNLSQGTWWRTPTPLPYIA